MATTTPNFGWDIPQSTDLVKDGATAIAALGTDIDTALVDLKGGTTGQILSKASNTDLDFTWVVQNNSWATYTPTNTGITVGNGTQTARFVRIGKTVVVSYRFVLGSTSSVTGGVSVGLPSTANSQATCVVQIADAGTNNYTGFGNVEATQTAILLRGNRTDGTYGTWSDNLGSMFTWATNDILAFSLVYEEQ